jgi:ABC-2 type transport system ATP-binding protein
MQVQPIIEIMNVTKDFGSFRAVNNLNLEVVKGDIFGFLGPNGAGKSTTIRMLLSLIMPTAGEIRIFGKSLLQHRSQIMRNIGAIVEKPDFYLYLTARKNLEILGRLSGADTSSKQLDRILDMVQLLPRAQSKVKTFSYGMKQRLGIAQALLHDPELIVLDEPTNGLDPVGVKEMRELILQLSRDHGKTVFISSHILPEVELIASRMAIINKGSTIVQGTVKELLNSGKLTVRFEVDNAQQAASSIRQSNLAELLVEVQPHQLIFELNQQQISKVNAWLINNSFDVYAIASTRSLEEYFLSITGSQE